MQVLLVNGSPNRRGNTYHALSIVEKGLLDNGIETNWFHIGNRPVRGCTACNSCKETNRCVFKDDICNDLIDAILALDGIIIGSP